MSSVLKVLDLDPLEALAQAAELVGQLLQAFLCPEHAGACIHVPLHLLADGADLLVAAGLLEVGRLDPPRLVPQHRVHGVGRHRLGRAGVLGRRAAAGGSEDKALRERV